MAVAYAEAAWLGREPARAWPLVQRLGARAGAAMVSRRLCEIGAPRSRPRSGAATKANPANLTEREVLALVAEGPRSAEILDRLFVPAKTVDHQVSAILARLGVRTRGEAARAAVRLGLEPGTVRPPRW